MSGNGKVVFARGDHHATKSKIFSPRAAGDEPIAMRQVRPDHVGKTYGNAKTLSDDTERELIKEHTAGKQPLRRQVRAAHRVGLGVWDYVCLVVELIVLGWSSSCWAGREGLCLSCVRAHRAGLGVRDYVCLVLELIVLGWV
ncbi:hypothetical protein RRG08_022919 [Elysia crispata]|uniref:Uncharacterized protein n=1 Tax=Elysia crispata TaxID=231223 RepID=A0AAE0XNE9_9GAST|nr:hypothetical protein RRG08_022919 [Elysia crispata]